MSQQPFGEDSARDRGSERKGHYGRVDPFEAFAEAFIAWVGLPSYQTERDRLYRIDRESASFFDAITLQL